MTAYRIKTEDGNEHITGDPGQALHCIAKHGKPVTVTIGEMSLQEYDALPSTQASYEFFRQ